MEFLRDSVNRVLFFYDKKHIAVTKHANSVLSCTIFALF
jgi:hypothetical protein